MPDPIFAFCANGCGWHEVQDYEGLLLCVARCWRYRKRIAAQLRAVQGQRAVRKGGGLERVASMNLRHVSEHN